MRMKKFINDPKNLVAELLEGMVLAFPDKVQLISRNILARAVPKEAGKVRLVTLAAAGTSRASAASSAKVCSI